MYVKPESAVLALRKYHGLDIGDNRVLSVTRADFSKKTGPAGGTAGAGTGTETGTETGPVSLSSSFLAPPPPPLPPPPHMLPAVLGGGRFPVVLLLDVFIPTGTSSGQQQQQGDTLVPRHPPAPPPEDAAEIEAEFLAEIRRKSISSAAGTTSSTSGTSSTNGGVHALVGLYDCGAIAVAFEDIAGAKRCCAILDGRRFDGRQICAVFISTSDQQQPPELPRVSISADCGSDGGGVGAAAAAAAVEGGVEQAAATAIAEDVEDFLNSLL